MKSWILTSTLPDEIRLLPDILNPSDPFDATYQGIVVVIVSLIYVHGGILPEGTPIVECVDKVEAMTRHLRYLSLEENTPIMSTDKLLTLMVKQGYIDSVKDTTGGETRKDYHLGPRGKVEVGKPEVLAMIQKVSRFRYAYDRFMARIGTMIWRKKFKGVWQR